MYYMPDVSWGAICPECKRPFNLGDRYAPTIKIGNVMRKSWTLQGVVETMEFPNGNLSSIRLTCPHCEVVHDFRYNDLLKPSDIVEPEDQGKQRLPSVNGEDGLRKEIKALQSEKETLTTRISEQKVEIQRLRNNNDKLTEDNKILSHALQDLMTQKEKTEGK